MKSNLLFLASITVLLFSCQPGKEQPKALDPVEIAQLADTLNLEENQYADLLGNKNNEQTKRDLFFRKIHLQKRAIDSLTTQNLGLAKENGILNKANEKPALTRQERGIQNMVHHMHKSWIALAKNQDPQEILKYFNDKYLISRITINDDNTASVSRFSHEDFQEYIEKEILGEEGLAVEFSDVNFLDIEIKDNSYFNIAYKCMMGAYKGDRLIETNSLLVSITGKNIDGKWGISSYSWVNFKYQ